MTLAWMKLVIIWLWLWQTFFSVKPIFINGMFFLTKNKNYFLIPVSTENYLIYFLITRLHNRQGDKNTVFVVVESRSILYYRKTFSCVWVTTTEKQNMMESFCWRFLSVSCSCLSFAPHFFHLQVHYAVNYTIPSHMWVHHSVRNVGPPHCKIFFLRWVCHLLHNSYNN